MAEEKFEDKQLAKHVEAKMKGEEKEEEKGKRQAPEAAKAEAKETKEEKHEHAGHDHGKEKEEKEKPKKFVLERKYTFNLTEAYGKPKYQRCNRAISMLKALAIRHMKGKEAKIDTAVNNAIRKSAAPLKKIAVMLRKDEDGMVYVSHAQEQKK